jgi:hypothetical protein
MKSRMKVFSFSFRSEPIWMLAFNLAIIFAGILIALVVTLLRYLKS